MVVVMTRWGMKDLTARLIKSQVEPKSDQWEVIEFPAILNEHTEDEKPLWPSYWSLEEHQLKTFMYSMINSPVFVTVMYHYQGI